MSAEESVYPRLRATRLSWERISYIEHIAREKVHRYWRWYIDQTVSSSSLFYRRNVWTKKIETFKKKENHDYMIVNYSRQDIIKIKNLATFERFTKSNWNSYYYL